MFDLSLNLVLLAIHFFSPQCNSGYFRSHNAFAWSKIIHIPVFRYLVWAGFQTSMHKVYVSICFWCSCKVFNLADIFQIGR